MSIEAKFKLQQGGFLLNVDCLIPVTGITVIYGESGAGKTTLLRAIAGLEKIKSGYLKFADQVWQDDQRIVATHQRRLAYIFQEASLFDHLDVRANIEYGAKRTALESRSISIEYAIDQLDIGPLLSRHPVTLSGGERQRVAIARAIASSPKLLLMDEPLAGLDRARKQELMPFLESLHQSLNIPIIYVSHSMDEVARLADHLVILEAGKVLDVGPIREMLTRLDLPLAQDESAESLIDATVAAHDEPYKLSYLDFAGGQFTVTQKPLGIGEKVRIRIAARDVSITLQRQTDTSVLNCFAATIEELSVTNSAQTTVRLSIQGVSILARVTRKSVAQLDLAIGKNVFVQIKSAAVLS